MTAFSRTADIIPLVALPYKFGVLVGDQEKFDEEEFEYGHVWAREGTTGPDRVISAPRSKYVGLLQKLMEVMPDPFWILYVLVVPRGGGEAARYQSADVHSRDEIKTFLSDFEQYFECDGRHHVWIGSEPSDALLIYDNHNVIYGYGPLDDFAAVFRDFGLREDESVRFPVPHTHRYNQEFDGDESRVLKYWEWKPFPLQNSDT